jgi:hypothetical protein
LAPRITGDGAFEGLAPPLLGVAAPSDLSSRDFGFPFGVLSSAFPDPFEVVFFSELLSLPDSSSVDFPSDFADFFTW